MSEMCNYGLIGSGMMGHEHIRNVALIENARVAAVFEPDAAMAAATAALVPDASFHASIADLLARPDLDALIVASPNYLHAGQLAEIMATRPLPVLMEKPLFTDPAEAALIDKLIAENPAPVWVAMEYRYMPPIAAFVERVRAATGGIKMLTIREHRFPFLQKVGNWNRFNRYSGGTLVEKCCHFFDLMRFILGDEPVRVMASGGQSVNHLDEVYDGERSDIWDNAYVIVDFRGGARAMLELCMFADGSLYQEELSAVGPEGKIEAFVPGPARFWPGDQPAPQPHLVLSPRHVRRREVIDVPVDPLLLSAGDHNGATYYQHLRFAEVVRGRAAPEVTLSDGALAVRMGMAAQESARSGQSVTL